MSLLTHIEFGNPYAGIYPKKYLVVETATHFFRSDDGYHPDTFAKCTSMDITVVAPDKSDLFLQEWFFSKAPFNGRLVSELSDPVSSNDNTVQRTLEFTNAQCYSFSEHYDIDSSSLRLLDLKIKMEKCVMDGVDFNNWSF